MAGLTIGLLGKKRGNLSLQEKFVGASKVDDTTAAEVEHHEHALLEAGFNVRRLGWGPDMMRDLRAAVLDLVFNVSSLAEAAILEEMEIPYVGSHTAAIAVSTDKSLAKRLWLQAGLPTAPYVVAWSLEDCKVFKHEPPFPYPLFIKPVAGRGSAGVNRESLVHGYDQLIKGVAERLATIGQPVLIEKYLHGREITWGVVGNGGSARILPPLEIAYREGDVTLTFEKKEMDDDVFSCPAHLSPETRQEMGGLALRTYHALGFMDFGRIDMILTEGGPFLLEGNAFAGLMCTPAEKPHSYIGFMARAEGRDGAGLLDEIIWGAIERESRNH